MRLDGARGRHARISPHVAEQVLAREDPVGIGCELHEQGVLLLRDVYLVATCKHAAGPPVDDELAEIEKLAARRTPAEQRADARDEGKISHYGGVGQRLLGGVSPLSGQFLGFHDPYRDTLC
jgi:hypothetical protein